MHPHDPARHSLECMEILGGNRATREQIAAPGLDIWIDSRPFAGQSAGGDVHYVSTCGAGYVTRLALADVAGHGEAVDSLAKSLRQLMRKYINTLDQTRLARALNRELERMSDAGRFATAVLCTYFAPTGHLILCNAGHGRPLLYRASSRTWSLLDLEDAGECISLKQSRARYHLERLANLPLGVLQPIEYEQFAIQLAPGDVVLLSTDAIPESCDNAGIQLGEEGLLRLVQSLPAEEPARLGAELLAALDQRRGQNAVADDQTLILLAHGSTAPPRPSLARTASTLAKMIGLRKV